jgi:2-methylaconitate cis-trans-isomerase PrpF
LSLAESLGFDRPQRGHSTIFSEASLTMSRAPIQRRIPALYMRGGTSKGVFFGAICGTRADYVASSGKAVRAADIDIVARILSMGKLHHAMTGTAAVAVAAAAAVPGTVVSAMLSGARAGVRFGHPSGALTVGAEASEQEGGWKVTKVSMSRSARRLMEGVVYVPETAFGSAS